MNKMLIIVVVLMVAGGLWWMSSSSTQDSITPSESMESAPVTETSMLAANSVVLKDFSFSPQALAVKVGDTVTFTNEDVAGHTVTADDGSFDSGILNQGESTSVTFDSPGTFGYHCTPHPNMTVTVVVE